MSKDGQKSYTITIYVLPVTRFRPLSRNYYLRKKIEIKFVIHNRSLLASWLKRSPRRFLLHQVLRIQIQWDNIMCDLRIVVLNLRVICVRFIYDAKVPAAQDIMNLVQEVSF